MNLYRVRCVCRGSYLGDQHLWVYVGAADPKQAEEKAIERMKHLQWKFDDGVDQIEKLASVNTHNATHLLII